MKEYIDKSALVAEIDKHLSYYKDLKDRGILSKEGESAYRAVRILKSDINSIEVKEVDVENSFECNVCKNCNTYLKEMDKDAITKTLEPQERGGDEIIYTSSCEWCNRDSCEDCYDEED